MAKMDITAYPSLEAKLTANYHGKPTAKKLHNKSNRVKGPRVSPGIEFRHREVACNGTIDRVMDVLDLRVLIARTACRTRWD